MKRTPLKKKSKNNMAVLKRKLWKVFSQYIKERDNFTCYTCDRKATGNGMHCGHFIPKSVGGLILYFNEDNNHAQCYNCNINLGGNQYRYGEKLGKAKVNELRKLRGVIVKWSAEDYKEKIAHYTNLLSQAQLLEADK